jgi:hypothetical protein
VVEHLFTFGHLLSCIVVLGSDLRKNVPAMKVNPNITTMHARQFNVSSKGAEKEPKRGKEKKENMWIFSVHRRVIA